MRPNIQSFLRWNVLEMLELPPHLRSDLLVGDVGFWWRRQPFPERLQFAIKFIVGHGGGSSRVDVRCQYRAAIITERLAERSA